MVNKVIVYNDQPWMVYRFKEKDFIDENNVHLNPDYKEVKSILGDSKEMYCVESELPICEDEREVEPHLIFSQLLDEYKIDERIIHDLEMNNEIINDIEYSYMLSVVYTLDVDGNKFDVVSYVSGDSGYNLFLFTKDLIDTFSNKHGIKFIIKDYSYYNLN